MNSRYNDTRGFNCKICTRVCTREPSCMAIGDRNNTHSPKHCQTATEAHTIWLDLTGKSKYQPKFSNNILDGPKRPWPQGGSPAVARTSPNSRELRRRERRRPKLPSKRAHPGVILGPLGQLAAKCPKTTLTALNCGNHAQRCPQILFGLCVRTGH